MAIEILETKIIEGIDGALDTRFCEIVISGIGGAYLWGVGGLPAEGDLQTILEAREAELYAAAVSSGQIADSPQIQERIDFSDLETDITNELAWIETALTEIDTGLAAVDAAFPNAAQRAIIRGLLQNQRRVLLQQRRELKAWRFVVRRLG